MRTLFGPAELEADWPTPFKYSGDDQIHPGHKSIPCSQEKRRRKKSGQTTFRTGNRCLSPIKHAKRSGDIYLVFEPIVSINDFDGLTAAATHGSPWRYDSYVPVM